MTCPLTELPKNGCAHCRCQSMLGGFASPPELTADDIGDAFDARFDGHCENCGGRIHEGDVIARLVDDSGYACERCLP